MGGHLEGPRWLVGKDAFGTVQGEWTRFTKYEIRGEYIRPAPGARLEAYDPWQGYEKARYGALKHKTVPYEALLDLLDGLDFYPHPDRPGKYMATAETEAAILSWCGANGLLGLLLHQTRMAFLWPRWRALSSAEAQTLLAPPPSSDMPRLRSRIPLPTPDGAASQDWIEGGLLVPSQRRFKRVMSEWWFMDSWSSEVIVKGGRPGDFEPDELVSQEHIPSTSFPSGIFFQSLNGDLDFQPLSKFWARFFPDVPEVERETYSYPDPESDDFWWQYGETVDQFLQGAVDLWNSLKHLADAKPWTKSSTEERQTKWHGIVGLNDLLGPVSPALRWQPDGTFTQHWVAPSLLATFAAMALRDLTESHRAYRCACCGKLRASSAYQVRYCSKTCKERKKKQLQRAQKTKYAGGHAPKGKSSTGSTRS